MVIHIKFEKKDNIILTNEEIIKNMNILDNLLKDDNNLLKDDNNLLKENNLIDLKEYSIFYLVKNKNYFIILCIFIIILFLLIYYIKYIFK